MERTQALEVAKKLLFAKKILHEGTDIDALFDRIISEKSEQEGERVFELLKDESVSLVKEIAPQKGVDYFDGKDGLDGIDGISVKDAQTAVDNIQAQVTEVEQQIQAIQ